MSSSPQSSAGIQGLQFPEDGGSDFNAIVAIIKSILSRVATTTLVQVKKVTNDGGVAAVGFVDIQPMINQVDGDGNAVPHGTIFGVPYQRVQGGTNAVILDPQPGDIGIAVFASRDIAGVIAKRAAANPGSNGRFRWSDALYIGGVLNGVPTQWVRFSDDGIELHSPTAINLQAPTITLDCDTLTFNATTAVDVTAPIFTIHGAVNVTETLTAAVVEAPIVTVETTLTVASVPIGPTHEHNLTGGGHTLGVKFP